MQPMGSCNDKDIFKDKMSTLMEELEFVRTCIDDLLISVTKGDLNDHLDDKFQIASTYLFDVTTLILQPLVMVSREEHYDQDITLREIIRHIFTKVSRLSILHYS